MEEVNAASAGSCDFRQGRCGYKQGCREHGAPEWRYNQGYFEMRATRSGGVDKTSVLESPLLDITSPSCLSFTAYLRLPVHLAVVLGTIHTNCTLLPEQTHGTGDNISFAVDLPLGLTKVMFQGFHGGDTVHYVRIYSVGIESIDNGCCHNQEGPYDTNDNKITQGHLGCKWTFGYSTTAESTGRGQEPQQRDSNVAALAAGVAVAVLVVVAVVVGVGILWRRGKKNRQQTDSHNSTSPAAESPPPPGVVSLDNYERLNAVSEAREYAVLRGEQRDAIDSTYYDLPLGEGSVVVEPATQNPSYQNLPNPENGRSAMATEGTPGNNDDYLTPAVTLSARDATLAASVGDSSDYYLTPVAILNASEDSRNPEYLTIIP